MRIQGIELLTPMTPLRLHVRTQESHQRRKANRLLTIGAVGKPGLA